VNFKKITSLVIATAITAALISGCRGTTTSNIETPEELTIHMHFFDYCVYDEDWPIFQKAAEITGIKLRGTVSETISNSGQAYSTMLVENTLPDIIHYTTPSLTTLAKDGGLIPLDDLIDKYAPNIKKFFEECAVARLAATAPDGHIYFIPGSLSGVDENAIPAMGWFIRQDWLDKLGLKRPTTVQELHDVLLAFKQRDPNGNGEADEIPLFKRAGGISDILQLFDADNGWRLNKDGKLVFGQTEEAYKNAMRELAKWYKEGIIDPEIFSRGSQARDQLLSTDKGGCTHDWFSSTASYNDKYAETVPGLNFIPITPPADINGVIKETTVRGLTHGLAWGISKDNKYPEATIKYFDFWLSEEGRTLNGYGVEGLHYNVVDGEKVFTNTVLSAKEGIPTYMRNQGQVEIGTVGSLATELAGMNEIALKGFNEYRNNKYGVAPVPPFNLNEEENEIKNQYYTNLTTFMNEQQQKWLMGVETVDATWDKYIETITNMNYYEIEKIYNDAYNRIK
jgi:putative aldouronate transport system substrate-binding protein